MIFNTFAGNPNDYVNFYCKEILEKKFQNYVSYEDAKVYNATFIELFNYFLKTYENVEYKAIGSGDYIFTTNNFLFLAVINNFNPTSEIGRTSYACYSENFDVCVDVVKNFENYLKPFEVNSSKTINWASLQNGQIINTVLNLKNYPEFHKEFYPYINNMDIDGYIDDFMKSSSNILILTGDPGLGKSSLINHIIQKASLDCVIAYDEEVMKNDTFYIQFVTHFRRNCMILEDADLLLESRAGSANKVMSKLLNVADGIMDMNKKFIFTANIKRKDDIDEALIRPGRCFDVIQFRPLNIDEALVAAEKIGKTLLPNKTEYTVAEIYNSKEQSDNVLPIRKIGFG